MILAESCRQMPSLRFHSITQYEKVFISMSVKQLSHLQQAGRCFVQQNHCWECEADLYFDSSRLVLQTNINIACNYRVPQKKRWLFYKENWEIRMYQRLNFAIQLELDSEMVGG